MIEGQPTNSPDEVLSQKDPGDATAQRYQYQWVCAAIACCMLLDELEDVTEVFCEHHEDVLLKHSDGFFTGQQIKTRESSQPVWKTSDEAVRHACVRFAQLEASFSGRFRRFHFLTNHPLYVKDNGQDLAFVLKKIREAQSACEVEPPANAFLKRVASDAGCSQDIAHAALSKANASDGLAKLADIRTRLVSTLTEVWAESENCTAIALLKAADHLSLACGQASSLSHVGLLPAYLPMVSNPCEAEIAARLAAKRITKERVIQILTEGLNQVAPLHGDIDSVKPPGSGSADLLRAKMQAGGFSEVSCNSATDLRDKADYLGLVWTKKFGQSAGLQRYNHVRSLVLSDAASAFEVTKKSGLFGREMLVALRERFWQRRKLGGLLYDCSDEHLEGVAYSLSAQCQVQWSSDRPWEN